MTGAEKNPTEISDAERKKIFEPIYWSSIISDPKLKLCEPESKWVWFVMLLYMACESPDPGRLVIERNGTLVRPEFEDLERVLFEPKKLLLRAINDLETHGVFSRETSGVIFCRRQVRKREVSEIRRQAVVRRTDRAKGGSEICTQKIDTKPLTKSPVCVTPLNNYNSNSDHDPTSEEGVQREGVTLTQRGRSAAPLPHAAPSAPDAFISRDVFGVQQVVRLWDENRSPDLPAAGELQRPERDAITRVLNSDNEHIKSAWWLTWIRRTCVAKFLQGMPFKPTLPWFCEDERHIAALLRGQYDNPPAPKPGTRTEPSTYKRPAGFVDYSKPLDEPRGQK